MSTAPSHPTQPRRRHTINLPLYMVPIVLGLCGVLFARQLPNPVTQIVVILISVAAPSFALGILLTRTQSAGFQRLFLIGGVILLIVGAMVTASNLPDSMASLADVPNMVLDISRWIGLTSLVVGLLAILFILARREEQIEEMVQRFSYLAEHLNEGFILTSRDGVVTLVNNALLALTGLKKEDVLGRNSLHLSDELNLKPMLNHIANPPRGLPTEYGLTWRVGNEERHLWFSAMPLFDGRGEYAGALATVRDVTERHRLSQRLERYTEDLKRVVEERTQRLHQSEQQFRELLVRMNEGFMTIDASYRVRFANARICDMLQKNVNEIVGGNVLEFIDPAGRAQLLELMDIAHAPYAKRLQCELALMRSAGSHVQVVAAVAPVEEATDQEARFSLVMTDITDLIHMQNQLEVRAQELEEANAELRMLDRAKDSFLANVSHELRTPLSTVRGYVEMFESGSLGALQGPQVSALQVLMRNVERLSMLIDEMIEFSRMEVRGIQLHLTVICVNTLLRECTDSIQPQAMAREIALSIVCPENPVYMWGDRKRMAQVLGIFLSNAVKFCDKGDTISVVGAAQPDGTVTMSVVDSGIGIPSDLHKRIFDKFFQVDSSLSRRYEGAGIGLSIAKSIAEVHGGTIDLKSEPGKGSAFTFYIPSALFDPTTVEPLPAGSEETNLLIIAGDGGYGEGLKSALQTAGYSVQLATGAHEGLRDVQEFRPSLIIIDETLHDLTGVNALIRLRSVSETADIPALLLVGEDTWRREQTPVLPAAVHVLMKPFAPRKLVARVRHAFGQTGAFDEVVDSLAPSGVRVDKGYVIAIGADADLTEWLCAALSRRRFVCTAASDLAQARALARERIPDVLFVDVDIAENAREQLATNAAAFGAELSIPVYFMTGLPQEYWNWVKVAGILRKPFSIKEISAAVSAALVSAS